MDAETPPSNPFHPGERQRVREEASQNLCLVRLWDEYSTLRSRERERVGGVLDRTCIRLSTLQL